MERILIRSQDLLQGIPAEVSDDQIGVGYTAVVLSADAQATIAALQAERDGWVRSREHYYQLWIRAIDERDEMRKERDDFEFQLTQRTAELDAAQRERDEAAKDRDDWITSWRVLQRYNERIEAELERVRGERDNALESRDWWRAQLDKERAKLAATSQEGQHESR